MASACHLLSYWRIGRCACELYCMNQARRVVFLTRVLTHYRVPFHDGVRNRLAEQGVDYELVYGNGRPDEVKKGDLVTLDWATKLPVSYFGPGDKLCWQHGVGSISRPDLMIIGQENTLLVNYPLIVRSWFNGTKVAYFGHGRGFQASSPNSLAERFKRFWASKVSWWFAYTPSGCKAVEAAGFPAEKITVFNNSVDTSAIAKSVARTTRDGVARLRKTLVAGSENVGVYVGGIYAHKRIAFLLDAADAIRALVPDFHLVVIGDGADAQLVRDAADSRDWLHYVGPKFGDEKTALVLLAKVFLMPGLVGLAVLDALAYGTPMVTTDLSYHSPEIDYLEDGINGVIVRESDDAGAYAAAVGRVLTDEDYRGRLQAGGRAAVETYTIENMAERFAQGVLLAIGR